MTSLCEPPSKAKTQSTRRDHASLSAHVCPDNQDEKDFPSFIGNFSKSLPHDIKGEVDQVAYRSLLRALDSRRPADFEAIPMGTKDGRKLINPQGGFAVPPHGLYLDGLCMPPAPKFNAAETAGEMCELYWMALARDVKFSDYSRNTLIDRAATELSTLPKFEGPRERGRVTPLTIFRGNTPADPLGPYVSQFLLHEVNYGALRSSQRRSLPAPNTDFVTDFFEWRALQNGALPTRQLKPAGGPRFIQSLRDLTDYVRLDSPYEPYLNACQILLEMRAPLDLGNPYRNSKNQMGFATLGSPEILCLLADVTDWALKAVWHQKWSVHRRLRPEEFGGRIHAHLIGYASYPIHSQILNSAAVKEVVSKNRAYLLPQAYPEGAPCHPAYGGGHAAIAGACATILKAWFDETFNIPNLVVPSDDGERLESYRTGGVSLTVGGELNKLASNISLGRNAAGIHWRSDHHNSLIFGQEIAIQVLRHRLGGLNEGARLTVRKFDGTVISLP